MSSLVIVAIPEEQDRVWKVSSEQVPHLTLLYLGDDSGAVQNLDQIMQFVDHAVTLSEHGPFYLDVDRRGPLGDSEADVLFFNKRSWNLKWIRQFRGQLLQNQQIRTAFDAAEQILEAPQEWAPHLTLGYPDTPAKEPEPPNDYPLYSVCFDRIAVWAENYNGPEFRLEWPEREYDGDLAIAYSDSQKAALTHYAKAAGISEAEFLAHHGVKGMKWGVRGAGKAASGALSDVAAVAPYVNRRARNTALAVEAGAAAVRKVKAHREKTAPKREAKAVEKAAKKLHKADVKWEKNQYTLPKGIERHNAMAEHFNGRIGALNDKFKNDDFSKTDWAKPSGFSSREKQYHDEIQKLEEQSFRHAVDTVHGTSPSGVKKMGVEWSSDGSTLRAVVQDAPNEAKHAASDNEEVFLFKVTRDSKGLVTDVGPVKDPEDIAAHGETFVEGLVHGSVLDNPTLAEQIKAKVQSILDDVKGDNKDANLFGDPLIQAKIRSVLQDFYQDPNVDNAVVYDALGEVFLEHYGIKGMRWGRRSTPEANAPSASSKVPHGNRRKTKIDVKGGENHPAHEDAVRVAESKAKLKKSGPAALSNNELRDVANRVQLENQVAVLTSHKGKQFVTRQLQSESQNLARAGVREGVKRGVKRAGAAGAATAVAA